MRKKSTSSIKNNFKLSNKFSEYFRRLILAVFHFLLLATPLYFNFSTDELFEFNKMMLVYLGAIILGSSWIILMILERKIILRWHWFHLPILMFLLTQFLTTLTSIHPYTSWLGYYSRFHGGLLSTLSYTVIYFVAVSLLNKKDLIKLAFTTLLAGFLVSIYAIFEHFGHSFSCLSFAIMENSDKSASFQFFSDNFNVSCWVQKVQDRVFASFGQPNWLAAYLIMLIPISLWVIQISKNWWFKSLAFISLASMSWALIYTKSRSGLLALVAVLSIFILGWILQVSILEKKKVEKVSWIYVKNVWGKIFSSGVTLGLAIIGVAIIFSGRSLLPGLESLFASLNQTEKNDQVNDLQVNLPPVDRLDVGGTDSGEIRKIVWEGAYKVWQRYPLFGSGPETFAYSYYADRPEAHNLVSEWDFLYNKAHNEFLNFLATTGLVGFAGYMFLLISGWILAGIGYWRCIGNDNTKKALAFLTLLAGSVGLAVSNFFGFSTVMVSLLQFLFWASTVILLINNENDLSKDVTFQVTKGKFDKEVASQSNSSLKFWQYLALAGVVFFASQLFTSWWRYYQADLNYAAGQRHLKSGQATQAYTAFQQSLLLNPYEAQYWDTFANLLAQLANAQTTTQDEYTQAAIQASDRAIFFNPQQRNFYKSRARLFMILAEKNPGYYQNAIESLTQGIKLSPTDAKLLFNRGLLFAQIEERDKALADWQKAILLKPNYEQALVQLAQDSARAGDFDLAIQYANQIALYHPLNPSASEMIASYSAKLVWETQ